MTPPPAPRVSWTLGAVGFVVIVQLCAAALIQRTGFSAISDDDFARVVIAQQFVQAPSWDPSGTSWLPFPFLHQGAALWLFGPTLEVARLWSIFCSCVAAALLFASGRVWQLSPLWATAGAVFALSTQYAMLLSVATVPEYLTAALLVFALATLGREDQDFSLRWAGGACLFLACASRYEAWPAAFGFAALTSLDGWKKRDTTLAVPALTALAFPLLWTAYGALHHGSPLFFVKRVVDYKAALGNGTSSNVGAALEYLKGLALAEPQMTGALLAVLLLSIWSERRLRLHAQWWRPLAPLSLVFFVLVAGALRGGAPTHHSERALLSIWLLGAIAAARIVERRGSRRKLALSLAIVGGLLGHSLRSTDVWQREPFVDRRDEVEFGKQLSEVAQNIEPVGIMVDDFGYFAILASAGHPERFEILKTHDPRESDSIPDPIGDFKNRGGCLYVTSTNHLDSTDEVWLEWNGRYVVRYASGCPADVRETRP